MSQKIIFHVGTSKTATTSIQHVLMDNRVRLLRAFSLYYPFSARLAKKVEARRSAGELYLGGGNFNKKIIKAFKSSELEIAEKLLSSELHQVSQKGANTTLYSGEALLALGQSLEACELFSRVAERFFDQVEIVCCVRPPLDHTSSRYCEYVKRRTETRSFNDCFNEIVLDFSSRLNCYAQAFGGNNIKILPYEDSRKESILKRFFAHIDRRLLSDETIHSSIDASRRNRSLSPLECEAIRHINRVLIGYGLNRVQFVKAYNSYMEKFAKDMLRRYFYVSGSALSRFENLIREPLLMFNNQFQTFIPASSVRFREGMLSASHEFSAQEKSRIYAVAWRVLHELSVSLKA